MKLLIEDRGYGCFRVTAKCNECNKILFGREFSYDSDHIGIGNKEKIYTVMENNRQDMEMNYCFKCGCNLAGKEK